MTNITKICKEIEKCLLEKNSEIFFTKTSTKESGHANAPKTEEAVSNILEKNKFKISYERKKNGQKAARSISDVIVSGLFCNVKSGVLSEDSKGGQPNICSLKRLYKKIISKELDAYIIIWVKSDKVRVFDVLSNLEYIVYNDGTGQCMLKENIFLKNFDNISPHNAESIKIKCDKIKDILVKGYEAHRIKKKSDIEKILKLNYQ
jgi:hypothetical protein